MNLIKGYFNFASTTWWFLPIHIALCAGFGYLVASLGVRF